MSELLKIATEEEITTIKNHCDCHKGINISMVTNVYRDEKGILHVAYGDAGWWHYSEKGEWW